MGCPWRIWRNAEGCNLGHHKWLHFNNNTDQTSASSTLDEIAGKSRCFELYTSKTCLVLTVD